MSFSEEIKGIKISKENLITYCNKNHLKKLAFFGSILRDDFNSKSDIDILVEFEKKILYLDYLLY